MRISRVTSQSRHSTNFLTFGRYRLVSLAIFLLLSLSAVAADQAASDSQDAPIVLLVSPSVIKDLPEFLDGDEILNVHDFDRPNTRRDMVDYILLRQALALGSDTLPPIQIEPWLSISHNRVLISLAQGSATALSDTLWREDIKQSYPSLYVSSPTLAEGKYTAGLYMNPDHPKRLTAKNLADVQQLTAVSNKQWRPDWEALQSLHLKRLEPSVNWENMIKMVHRKRADFMLIPFSHEPDMAYTAMGVTLKPIPGLKVVLKGSRGWAVSRNHPMGERFYGALERGMEILHERGSFTRAYQEAGLLNSATDQWQLLNPL